MLGTMCPSPPSRSCERIYKPDLVSPAAEHPEGEEMQTLSTHRDGVLTKGVLLTQVPLLIPCRCGIALHLGLLIIQL